MRVLVTNDDGILAAGLAQLARAACERGHDVVVAAPRTESSGASCSLASVQEQGRTVIEPHPLEALRDVPVFAVAASPAFISLLALRGAFGPPPELVVSGVNEGPNTGRAVIHSGTVGAALTAATYGARGMAVSMELGEPRHWTTAQPVIQSGIDVAVAAPVGTTLNLNVPNRAVQRASALRRAHLAPFGTVQMQVAERGEGYVKIEYGAPLGEAPDDTDAALLAEGFATVTALQATGEATFSGLAQLVPG
jgi:5'-nucleotidase